jgi:hypothetical protein
MSCSICCETFNKQSRSRIVCLFCSFPICQSCCRRYILGSRHLPHCSNCRKEWSREFLSEHIADSFLFGDYKRSREDLLFEEQQPLLAATQVRVPFEKRRRGLEAMLAQTELEIAHLRHHRSGGFEELRLNKLEIREQYYLLELIEEKLKDLSHEPARAERQRFVMKCAQGDCRGFLSTRYKCGTCEVTVCSSCHEPLVPDHVCDPATVQSVSEIKKTTRNCPSCHTPIYKSGGCDQMWCIVCHTAFSFEKGTIEEGIVHNPHYFQFMREHGHEIRNPNEVLCGGLPHRGSLLTKFRAQDRIELDALYRKTVHYRQVELPHIPTGLEQEDAEDLRLSYLLGDIGLKEFKQQLQRREKQRNKNREYRQLVETYVNVMEDLLRQIDGGHLTPLQVVYQEEELVATLNRHVVKIMDMFKVKLPLIVEGIEK